jgi:hypothetical protein
MLKMAKMLRLDERRVNLFLATLESLGFRADITGAYYRNYRRIEYRSAG